MDGKRFSDRKSEHLEIIKRKTSKLVRSKIAYVFARFILGGVFLYASMPKILNPYEFSQIIYQYKILPDFLIYFISSILPWIEFFCGVFLLIGIFIRSSALILSSLLLIFILAISINLLRGINIACGCFSLGGGTKSNELALIIRDFLIFPLGLILIFYNRKKKLNLLEPYSD